VPVPPKEKIVVDINNFTPSSPAPPRNTQQRIYSAKPKPTPSGGGGRIETFDTSQKSNTLRQL
jgi:hypothetical protein